MVTKAAYGEGLGKPNTTVPSGKSVWVVPSHLSGLPRLPAPGAPPAQVLRLGGGWPHPSRGLSASLPPTTERRRGRKRGTLRALQAPKIRVENGRIQIDEPTDLPNGTELYLMPATLPAGEPLDELDDEERAELHQAIREGFEDAKAGRTIPAEQWLAELRSRL